MRSFREILEDRRNRKRFLKIREEVEKAVKELEGKRIEEARAQALASSIYNRKEEE